MSETEDRMYPGGKPAESSSEEVLSQATQAMKDRWLSILIQLTKSARFNNFIEANYTIGDTIDDENKTIETLVIEKPESVGPPLTMNQISSMHSLLKQSGCKDVHDTVLGICRILGQQEYPHIQLATESDMAVAVEQADLKRKLDA